MAKKRPYDKEFRKVLDQKQRRSWKSITPEEVLVARDWFEETYPSLFYADIATFASKYRLLPSYDDKDREKVWQCDAGNPIERIDEIYNQMTTSSLTARSQFDLLDFATVPFASKETIVALMQSLPHVIVMSDRALNQDGQKPASIDYPGESMLPWRALKRSNRGFATRLVRGIAAFNPYQLAALARSPILNLRRDRTKKGVTCNALQVLANSVFYKMNRQRPTTPWTPSDEKLMTKIAAIRRTWFRRCLASSADTLSREQRFVLGLAQTVFEKKYSAVNHEGFLAAAGARIIVSSKEFATEYAVQLQQLHAASSLIDLDWMRTEVHLERVSSIAPASTTNVIKQQFVPLDRAISRTTDDDDNDDETDD